MKSGAFNFICLTCTVSLQLLVCLTAVAESLLEHAFQNPPADTRPTVWWRFMDDFAAREGIVLELDTMKRMGLSGGGVMHEKQQMGSLATGLATSTDSFGQVVE